LRRLPANDVDAHGSHKRIDDQDIGRKNRYNCERDHERDQNGFESL
jgi:hypothetical protein